MPLPSSLVGATTTAHVTEVDVRWTMAYAAGIDDANPRYLDPSAAPVVAHPLFPVGPEWPVVLDARHLAPAGVLSREEAARGVHATHDLVVHRLVRPGDVLTTTATIEGVERRAPGAYEVLRLDTVDDQGRAVATTRMGTLFLGVDVVGDDRPATDPSSPGPSREGGHTGVAASVIASVPRPVARTAAHVYTECARIWNPIHTDVAAAQAAGLPDIVLHGTATLAMAVTAIVDRLAGRDPGRVRRIGARFGATVLLPSTIEIRVLERHGAELGDGVEKVWFDVRTQDGAPAIRDGFVVLDHGG